jgi:glycosyltransferase involved in cell wall biosynthesis
MRILYFGGYLPEKARQYIEATELGRIQNAAQTHEAAIVGGLASIPGLKLSVVSLPLVGSYPKRSRALRFPHAVYVQDNFVVSCVGFNNLSVYKYFSRFYSSLISLMKQARAGDWLVVYSADPIYLLASYAVSRMRGSMLCLVLPDLPEHFRGGFASRVLYRFVGWFLRRVYVPRLFALISLTKYVAPEIGIDVKKQLVLEGIYINTDSAGSCGVVPSFASSEKYILYCGSLDAAYGLIDLVDAYTQSDFGDCQLWLCGRGDCEEYIKAAAARCEGIKYLGQQPRAVVLQLQREATVLVNPRTGIGDYTRFSFPSKTMEYLASGVPVVMHRLSGVPDDYYAYCHVPEDESVGGLAKCLKDVLGMPEEERRILAARAAEFILKRKNARVQAEEFVRHLLACAPNA